MDNQRRPGKRYGGFSNQKSGSGRFVGRGRGGNRPVLDSTAAEDLAEYVLTVLARDPNAVQIVRNAVSPARQKLVVQCDPQVTGRLIGKEGRTITALRQLVRAVSGRYGKRVEIVVSLSDD